MPKMKTHSGTKKRVKKTGTGKLKVQHTNKVHLLSNKSSSSKRRNKGSIIVSKGDMKRIKQQVDQVK
jgi:large subunit ribosomal protein L35